MLNFNFNLNYHHLPDLILSFKKRQLRSTYFLNKPISKWSKNSEIKILGGSLENQLRNLNLRKDSKMRIGSW